MRAILSLVGALILSGCAGLQYATDHYGGVSPRPVAVSGANWQVFDKPDEGRMMVVQPAGAALTQGMAQGFTLNSVNTMPPEPVFRDVARRYLAETGREGCSITEAYLIVRPQYEVLYAC